VHLGVSQKILSKANGDSTWFDSACLKIVTPKSIGFILVPISNTQVGSKGLAISTNFLLGGGLQLETPSTCHMVSRKYLHSHGQRLNWIALRMEFNSQLIDGYQWLFNLKIKKTTSLLLSKDGNCHVITLVSITGYPFQTLGLPTYFICLFFQSTLEEIITPFVMVRHSFSKPSKLFPKKG